MSFSISYYSVDVVAPSSSMTGIEYRCSRGCRVALSDTCTGTDCKASATPIRNHSRPATPKKDNQEVNSKEAGTGAEEMCPISGHKAWAPAAGIRLILAFAARDQYTMPMHQNPLGGCPIPLVGQAGQGLLR